MAAWKQRVREGWADVKILSAEHGLGRHPLGSKLEITATVELGPNLTPDDVSVQVLHGSVDLGGDLTDPTIVSMHSHNGSVPHRFTCELPCVQSGTFGYVVRVVPAHPDLDHYSSVGCITWIDGALDG